MDTINEYKIDNIGPEKVILGYNKELNFRWFVVIDNTKMGFLAKGGTMMAKDLRVDLIARKARGMSLKNALANLPLGGGKSGIVFDPKSSDKEAVVRGFARDVRSIINAGMYTPGMDVGINENDIAVIIDELKNPQAATGARVRYDELGITGCGVVESIKAAAKIKKLNLKGATIAIQGFGAVGRAVAKFTDELGMKIVAVSDSKTALLNDKGLNVKELIEAKENGGLDLYKSFARQVDHDKILFADVDVLCLGAKEDVLNGVNAIFVKANIIAEGANFPCDEAAHLLLMRHDKIVAPDIVANSGGIIAAYCELKHAKRTDKFIIKQAFDLTKKTIYNNTLIILKRALKEKITPKEMAIKIAQEKLSVK